MSAAETTTGSVPDEELLARFEQARTERLQQAWRTYQPRNPIASDLPDCDRYQVVRLFGWRVRPPPEPPGLEAIENGRAKEPVMIRQLQDEGHEVVELQSPLEVRQPLEPGGPKRLLIRGKIDGKIRVGRELLPFDTKDTSEYVLHAVEDEEDLKVSPWTRKWWRQLQLYLLAEGHDRGLLILGFRGRRKVVVVHLDYEEAERILRLCAWAVQLAQELEDAGLDSEEGLDQALAERGVPYHSDYRECRRCPFFERACFPPSPAPARVQEREDLAETVHEYVEAKPYASKAERLRRKLKAETEGYPQTVAGDYVIEGEVKTRRLKAQPAKPAHNQEYWSVEVRPVGEHEKE